MFYEFRTDTLKAGGRDNSEGYAAEDVYIYLNGEWTEVPSYECDAPNIGFTKQGCFDGMGENCDLHCTSTAVVLLKLELLFEQSLLTSFCSSFFYVQCSI